jgi:GNAT superfamily N-acetyltransferase
VTPDRPWTIEYERSIRTEVAGALAAGYVSGNGYWLAGRLGGINTWAEDRDPFVSSTIDKVWRSSLLAVATECRNHDIGRALKEQLITEARAAGVKAITSMVRWDNGPILSLNRKLGGSEFPIPRDDGPDEIHCWSIVPVLPV